MSNKTAQAWSLRRRAGVAAAGSVAIVFIAFIIGGGSYAVLGHLGLVGEKALKRHVTREVMEDPQILAAVVERAQVQICDNRIRQLAYEYWAPMQVPVQAGVNGCMQLTTTMNDGTQTLIAFTKHGLPKATVLALLLAGLETVQTETISIDGIQATLIDGLHAGSRRTSYIVGIQPEKTWEITIFPSSDTVIKQFEPTLETLTLE
jgi:hypothetical protein